MVIKRRVPLSKDDEGRYTCARKLPPRNCRLTVRCMQVDRVHQLSSDGPVIKRECRSSPEYAVCGAGWLTGLELDPGHRQLTYLYQQCVQTVDINCEECVADMAIGPVRGASVIYCMHKRSKP